MSALTEIPLTTTASDAIRYWVDYFDIDGLRLDVAYCLDRDFIRRLRGYTDSLKEDFYLIGEILGGDYKTVMGEGKLHSATNYECYKGLIPGACTEGITCCPSWTTTM